MDTNSIFISQKDYNKDISGKISYTNIIETIPKERVEKQVSNWKQMYKTEWRWRFLSDKERNVVEISYIKNNSNKRIYLNKNGEWVERDMDNYDQFVKKVYFAYTYD